MLFKKESYSLEQNKVKVPTLLIIDSIDTSLAQSKGIFKIIVRIGDTIKQIKQEINFRIPMTFPLGTESVRTIPIIEEAQEQITIECKFSDE